MSLRLHKRIGHAGCWLLDSLRLMQRHSRLCRGQQPAQQQRTHTQSSSWNRPMPIDIQRDKSIHDTSLSAHVQYIQPPAARSNLEKQGRLRYPFENSSCTSSNPQTAGLLIPITNHHPTLMYKIPTTPSFWYPQYPCINYPMTTDRAANLFFEHVQPTGTLALQLTFEVWKKRLRRSCAVLLSWTRLPWRLLYRAQPAAWRDRREAIYCFAVDS